MRVLFFLSETEWSGSVRAFEVAGRGLAEIGWHVSYAAPPGSDVERRLARAGQTVVPVEADASQVTRSFQLRKALDEHFVEVVFVHTEQEQVAAAFAARLAERAAVVRRTPAGGYLTVGPAARTAMKVAATGFLFTTKGELVSTPPPPGPLEPVVADIGVDVARYDALEPVSREALGDRMVGGSALIACVYDPSARVRAATVLRTVAMLRPRHPDLRLAIVGPGSLDEDLQMHVAALGLTSVVTMLGARDDEPGILRAADIGWVLAERDTGAFAVLDLMAMRIPVVVTRGVTAQRYVADGITGLLLPPDDASASAAAIAGLLAHDEQRLAMGSAGRNRVAREHPELTMVNGFARAAGAARDRSRWIR